MDNILDAASIGAAKYVLYLMLLGCAAVWLFAEHRRGKVILAINAILGLVIVVALIIVADGLFYHARPFVVDPSIISLIPHDPDNGFPSNHASAAGLMAVLIWLRHRVLGIFFALAAIIVAVGRVTTHVHHILDVSAGLALGAIAAIVGTVMATLILRGTKLLDRPPLVRLLGPEDPNPGRHRSN